MAANEESHPSDALIQAFGQGRLPPDEAARLEAHFADCPRCGEKLGQVGDDSYCALLRERPGEDPSIPPAPPDPQAAIPAELRNHPRYAVQRRVGFGGMGVVFEAMHRIMQRPVALKIIRPELLATPLAVSRFRREVQSAARLAHPNIVTAYDADEVAGVHFLVMEYVEGQSLEQYVRERGPLPVAQACALTVQIGRGLIHAHAQGMIHRDIKPANVMIAADGQAKILDFGLASWNREGDTPRVAPSLTGFGARLGTLLYAAPEQLESADRADARADQYGLGATLYFLLTGKPPLPVEPGKPASLEGLPSEVSAEVRAIVSRLLAYAPEDRYASMEAVIEALQPWCSQESAPRGTALLPRMRRRRVVASGLILAAVALGALAAWTWWPRGTPTPPHEPTLPILFLLPSQGLWYEDYFPAREVLEKEGFAVLLATPGGMPARLHEASMLGKPRRPEAVSAGIDVSDVDVHQFCAVVCVGYEHAEYSSGDTPVSLRTMRLLQRADRAERPIVAICAGQSIPGAAGLLQGKRVARQAEIVADLAAMGALPQPDRAVMVDGLLVTASTPRDAAGAAHELVRLLKRQP